MVGNFLRILRDGDNYQKRLWPSTCCCCYVLPFFFSFVPNRLFFSEGNPDVEHRMCERTTSARVFSWGQNGELFAISPVHWSQYCVSARSSIWVSITSKRHLLIQSPPVFAYHSVFALNRGYGQLIVFFLLSEFAICTFIMFLQTAKLGLTGTLQSDPELQPSVIFPMAVRVREWIGGDHGRLLHCQWIPFWHHYLALGLNALVCVAWAVVSFASVSNLSTCSMQPEIVSSFSKESYIWVVKLWDRFICTSTTWTSDSIFKTDAIMVSNALSRDEYQHPRNRIFTPLYVPDFCVYLLLCQHVFLLPKHYLPSSWQSQLLVNVIFFLFSMVLRMLLQTSPPLKLLVLCYVCYVPDRS